MLKMIIRVAAPIKANITMIYFKQTKILHFYEMISNQVAFELLSFPTIHFQ